MERTTTKQATQTNGTNKKISERLRYEWRLEHNKKSWL